MKKILILTVILGLMISPRLALAGEGSYLGNMGRDFVRGLKNVAGSPLEIPITIQDYHEQAGFPLVRHIAGFVDGTFRALTRMGSGLFDFMAWVLPGYQEGFPVKPETLF